MIVGRLKDEFAEALDIAEFAVRDLLEPIENHVSQNEDALPL